MADGHWNGNYGYAEDEDKAVECGPESVRSRGIRWDFFIVGWGYDDGMGGLVKDYQKALDYYKRALAKGLEKRWAVCNNIGFLYDEGGHGLPQDYKEANKWFKKSVDEGWEDADEACCSLGEKLSQRERG